MEHGYYESLKAGLEDAVAFINGDASRGRIVVRELPDSSNKLQREETAAEFDETSQPPKIQQKFNSITKR